MKIEIPVIGIRHGHAIVDDFFENVLTIANVNTGTIIGRPSKDMTENSKIYFLIKDNVPIQKKCESVSQRILDIYPDTLRSKLVYFIEIDIKDDALDLLTEEEHKLIKSK